MLNCKNLYAPSLEGRAPLRMNLQSLIKSREYFNFQDRTGPEAIGSVILGRFLKSLSDNNNS